MKNRILSVILTLMMLVSMMSAFAVPTSAATIAFTKDPSVLISGDGEYNIVFETNNVSIAYVTYKVDGVDYTVYDEENGVVRSDDAMHTVRVPQDQLDAAGSYTVVAKTVSSRDGFSITTSDQVTKTNTFNGYKGQKEVNFGFTSDTHWNNSSSSDYMTNFTKLVNNTLGRPDVMVLNGDIVDSLSTKGQFDALFQIINIAGGNGTYPVLYTVGNHEKRGVYSKEIEKYLTYSNGEFYTYFEYGPLAAFVSDVGEDKPDDNVCYTASEEDKIGVVDMERYFAEQLRYFKKYSGYGKDATYTFTIGHGPGYIGDSNNATSSTDFIDFFEAIGADVHFYGHNHQLEYKETTEAFSYPSVGVCSTGAYSGTNSFRGVKVSFATDADDYDMYTLNAYETNGSVAWSASIDADENGKPQEYVESGEEILTNTTTFKDFKAPVPNTTSDTVAITTAPVVFDAGDYYNVVWQTDVESAGYVYVDGTQKYYMDQHGGILRTETIHSVRIPKAELAGKTFFVMSRVVTNYSSAGHTTGREANWLTFGSYATGPAVKLNALPTGENYTVLAVANKADATSLNEKYTGTPDLVVLAGDVVENLNSEADFANLLTYANAITKGRVPVMLLRGENETKGAYAAELTRVLHTAGSLETMNKLYGATTAGNVTVIGLDTATKNADSTYTYAAFDALKAEQADWLKNGDIVADGNYGVVFANAENEAMAAGFANQNVQLAVVAGETTSYTAGEDFAVATIGTADALVITCGADEITVTEISDAETPVAGEVAVTEKVPEEEPDEPVVPDEPEEPVVGPTVAKIGDVEYDSVEKAIAAANNETVTLVADATAGMVIINPGVTVDLNGKKLTATYVIGLEGSNVIDTDVNMDGGIVVAKENVILSKNNEYISVYDDVNKCYLFQSVSLVSSAGNDRWSFNAATYTYEVVPRFGGTTGTGREDYHAMFADGGATTGVDYVIRVAWTDPNGTYTATQDFKYTEEIVATYFKTTGYSGKSFLAEFTGQDHQNAAELTIYTVVKSCTGVEILSRPKVHTK